MEMERKADNTQGINAFLNELTELTTRHGIEIDACGCCNSPYLWKNIGDNSFICAKNLEFDKKSKRYSVTFIQPGKILFD